MSLFVKQRYIEVLTSLLSFREGRYEDALRESFHKIDLLLEDESYNALLKEFRARPNPSDIRNSTPRTPVVLKPLAAPIRTSSPESDDGDSPSSPTPDNANGERGGAAGNEALKMIRELLDGAKKYRDEQHNQLMRRDAEGMQDLNGSTSHGTTPSAFVGEQEGSESLIASSPTISEVANDEFTASESDRDSEDSMDSFEFNALSIKVTSHNSPVAHTTSSKKSIRAAPVNNIITEAASQAVTTSLRALSASAANDVPGENAEDKPLNASEASVIQGGESPMMKKSESKKYSADSDEGYYSADSKGSSGSAPGAVNPAVLRQISGNKLDLTKQAADGKIEADDIKAEQKASKTIAPSYSKKSLDDTEKETMRSLDDSVLSPPGPAAAKAGGGMSGTLNASNNPPSTSAAPAARGTNKFVCKLRDHRSAIIILNTVPFAH